MTAAQLAVLKPDKILLPLQQAALNLAKTLGL